jgi:hypothetical protein
MMMMPTLIILIMGHECILGDHLGGTSRREKEKGKVTEGQRGWK